MVKKVEIMISREIERRKESSIDQEDNKTMDTDVESQSAVDDEDLDFDYDYEDDVEEEEIENDEELI